MRLQSLIVHFLKLTGTYDVVREIKLRLFDPGFIRNRAKMERFYKMLIREGDLVFDIGAHVGNYTEVFLRIRATVVAVEPQRDVMQRLRERFGHHRRVILLEKALDEKGGERKPMWLNSTSSTISSMSREWIERVKGSGRFSAYLWDNVTLVDTITLDDLIEEYGMPSFVKIDVEGFEYQVLKGLSQPVPALSFEFTIPEYLENALACVEYLARLGSYHFNYSIGNSMEFAVPEWVPSHQISAVLASLSDKMVAGDIYAIADKGLMPKTHIWVNGE